jgi:hypothetical protein
MTKWKALSKAFLVLGSCFYYWASNPALAQEQETYEDPAMAQTTAPMPSYSPDNPFATSEYIDIADVAEEWLRLGGNIDQYFYSEGFTTGTDGTLGNEHLCIRDDFNKVYYGRSDVCVNRAAADYDYIHFDQVNPTKFDSLAQLRNSMLDPDQIYKTGDLLGNTSQYWSGCFNVVQGGESWGGTSGGTCPNINDQYDGQINFGYVNQTLTNTAAIDKALQGVGLETTGYTYIWRVKNADANYEDMNNPGRVDPFEVTVKIYDVNGNSIYEKTYDYSRWIDSWTRFTGTETFDEPFNLDEISELQLSVTGYDIGYWAGYYGPEFKEPNINLLYRVAEPTGPSLEEILKEQMCMSDPTSDPTCPGYNDAMMAQIASTNTIDDINSGADIGSAINDGITQAFDDTTGITENIAEATGAIVDDGSDSGSDNGMPDPTQEATGEPDPVQEAVAEATPEPVQEATEQATGEPDPVQEATEQTTETAVAEATSETKLAGPGLNATQLSALNAANNVANSAVSSSTAAAQASAGIGLSESGGVSSTLTSVDPTGSTSADGSVASSTDFSGSTDGSTVATVEPMQNTNIGQTFDSSQGTTVDSNTFDSSTASVDTTQTFGGSQGTGATQRFSNNGSDNGQSQNSSTGTNNGSQSNDSFGSTDFASTGQTTQDSNPLAAGGAVETNDITGEQDLATSNEALTQLAMLNDPTNPINQIINDITSNLITQAVADAEETAEESAEESVESQNAQEDALVAEALAGSDDEDAQAALLGYNPNFRAYQQPQMQGGEIYNDQSVYENQKTYDSPKAGLFNGASDATHRAMVRQQYERGQ